MPIKPYSHPDDEQQRQQRVNEPFISYGYDTNASVSPIQFTVEELKKELELSMEQSRMGLGLSQEEMLNRKPSWNTIAL